MNDLEINNYAFLLSNIRNNCSEWQYGGAHMIFDNCHDWVNFFSDLGQCQTVITLYKQNKISYDLCNRVIDLFQLKHKQTVINLTPS